MVDLTAARAKVWETRRKKYGPRGHSGIYHSAPGAIWHERYKRCVDALCRLYNEAVLSEAQVAKITGLDRVTIRTIADNLQ